LTNLSSEFKLKGKEIAKDYLQIENVLAMELCRMVRAA
jgi:hypothetical protein